MAIVLVQMLRDLGKVPVFKSPTPFMDEFDLRGIRVIWVGHLGGEIEGKFSEGSGAGQASRPRVIYPSTFSATSSRTDPLGREWTTGGRVKQLA